MPKNSVVVADVARVVVVSVVVSVVVVSVVDGVVVVVGLEVIVVVVSVVVAEVVVVGLEVAVVVVSVVVIVVVVVGVVVRLLGAPTPLKQEAPLPFNGLPKPPLAVLVRRDPVGELIGDTVGDRHPSGAAKNDLPLVVRVPRCLH